MDLPTSKDVIEYFDIDYKSLQDSISNEKMPFGEKTYKNY